MQRDSIRFDNNFSNFGDCLSIAFTVFTVLYGIIRDLRDSHNAFGLPIVFESFSSKNTSFLDSINFKTSCLIFYLNF